MTQDALTIYQDFLDRTAMGLMARDADAFLRLIHLPVRIDTDNGTFELTDMTMARRHFTGFSDALKAQGADSYVRIATGAEFIAADRIRGRHKAHISSFGKLVAPVYENEMELVHRDGVWGACRIRHLIHFASWPDTLPRHEAP
jgi:hypothetical protein